MRPCDSRTIDRLDALISDLEAEPPLHASIVSSAIETLLLSGGSVGGSTHVFSARLTSLRSALAVPSIEEARALTDSLTGGQARLIHHRQSFWHHVQAVSAPGTSHSLIAHGLSRCMVRAHLAAGFSFLRAQASLR